MRAAANICVNYITNYKFNPFYRAMLCCPSASLSVHLWQWGMIGWNTSKIIAQLKSHKIGDLVQSELTQNSGGILNFGTRTDSKSLLILLFFFFLLLLFLLLPTSNSLLVKKLNDYSSSWQVISEVRGVTCRTGSHSVTFHPTQVNSPRLTPAKQAGTRFTYPGGMEGWVDLGDLLHTEMVYPPADGHPSKY